LSSKCYNSHFYFIFSSITHLLSTRFCLKEKCIYLKIKQKLSDPHVQFNMYFGGILEKFICQQKMVFAKAYCVKSESIIHCSEYSFRNFTFFLSCTISLYTFGTTNNGFHFLNVGNKHELLNYAYNLHKLKYAFWHETKKISMMIHTLYHISISVHILFYPNRDQGC